MYEVLKHALAFDLNTALERYMKYCQPHDENIVELLLQNGAEINDNIIYNYIGENMNIVIWNTFIKKGAVITEIMIEKYLDCEKKSLMILDSMVRNCVDFTSICVLKYMKQYVDPDILKILLQKNFDPNITTITGENCLHVYSGYSYKIIKMLLKSGVNPNKRDIFKFSILSRYVDTDIIRVLLKYGAKFKVKHVINYLNKISEIDIELLLKLIENTDCDNILHKYLQYDYIYVEIVDFLCEHIDVRDSNINCLSTYVFESQDHDIDVIYTLIEHGYDINISCHIREYIYDDDVWSRIIYMFNLNRNYQIDDPIYTLYCRGELSIAHPHLYAPLKDIAQVLLMIFKRHQITRHIAYIVLQLLFYNL